MTDKPKILDAHGDLLNSASGLVIRQQQEIPQAELDYIKQLREESAGAPTGWLHRYARIPEALYWKWIREGFDPTKEGAAKVHAKLKAEGYDFFIATEKKF